MTACPDIASAMKMPFPWAFPFVLAAALFSAGCGSDVIRVKGRLVQNGQPYEVDVSKDIFALDFHGTVDGKSYVFPASVNPDGTFSVDGSQGRGIPRGQYRISVMHSGYEGKGGEKLKERFMSAKTPLSVEITDSAPLTIDLGAATVTK